MVADWKQQELAPENGESSLVSPSACSTGTAEGSNSNSNIGGDGVGGGCDGRQGGEDDGKTPSIEKEHVQAVYDTIAPHWYVCRSGSSNIEVVLDLFWRSNPCSSNIYPARRSGAARRTERQA